MAVLLLTLIVAGLAQAEGSVGSAIAAGLAGAIVAWAGVARLSQACISDRSPQSASGVTSRRNEQQSAAMDQSTQTSATPSFSDSTIRRSRYFRYHEYDHRRTTSLAAAIIGGTLIAGTARIAGSGWTLLIDATLSIGLLAICAVDLSVKRVPTVLIGGSATLCALLIATSSQTAADVGPSIGGGIGAAGAAGLLAVARVASHGGIGRGDVRLSALLGLVVGWQTWNPSAGGVASPLIAAWASVTIAGAVASITHLWARVGFTRTVTLPFAPALCTGAFVVLLLA